jgi:hypothetical protein
MVAVTTVAVAVVTMIDPLPQLVVPEAATMPLLLANRTAEAARTRVVTTTALTARSPANQGRTFAVLR